ncbi:DUF5993 family protein [Nocardia sp. NPDC058658]|uniref:DUF5993 family protein n=1 Tax=Nocardia sp. NPDC058658 TaxID=3346580 RepID=UPI0036597BC4
MDTVIFAALLLALVLIFRDSSRRAVLTAWWISFVLCAVLLKVHITSGLGLGLTW